MKNILVVGGSYFAGRIFALYSARERNDKITVMNRGKYSLKNEKIREIICDRRDFNKMKERLEGEAFDVVVDFCAYEHGDINKVYQALKHKPKMYIFISTSSVYEPKSETIDEHGSLIKTLGNDETDNYIRGKILLEQELQQIGIPYLILRPGFIYGPFNYAPRESVIIHDIVRNNTVAELLDSDGKWSFVYVTDVAKAVYSLIDAEVENQIFNLAAPEEVDYNALLTAFRACAEVKTEKMTCLEAEKAGNKLPFPPNDILLYDGSKITSVTGYKYTALTEGIRLTYNSFASVFTRR